MKLKPGLGWILFGLVALALSTPAYAYLDPGTGSMIVAAIVAVLATLAMGIKTYWYKLTSLFRGKEPDPAVRDDKPRSG